MNEHGEMNLDLDRCEKEGEAAARAPGGSVSDCPYSFSKAGVDQKTFDREWRPRLNAWVDGWMRTPQTQRKRTENPDEAAHRIDELVRRAEKAERQVEADKLACSLIAQMLGVDDMPNDGNWEHIAEAIQRLRTEAMKKGKK